MRVIQATDYGSPFAGSFVPMLRAGALAARERGWDPVVVLDDRARQRDWVGALTGEGIEVLFAPVGARRLVTRWLEELVTGTPGPAIVHTHFTRFDLPAVSVARRRPEVKVVWHVHTVLSDDLRVRLANRVKLAGLSRYVARILCVAPHLAEAVKARGAPADKVEFFPNGLDVGDFEPASDGERSAARREIGVPDDATVLLHFGRNWHGKGGDLFLEAVKRLRDEGREDLVAVSTRGGEPARELAEQLGIGEVTYTPEDVARVQDLYAASNLFMATSRGEGLPLAVVEALVSGLPVVASEIPGHEFPWGELPNVEKAPLDPAPIAAAARELLDQDPAVLAEWAELGRDGIEATMGLDRWAERLMDVYADVAGVPN